MRERGAFQIMGTGRYMAILFFVAADVSWFSAPFILGGSGGVCYTSFIRMVQCQTRAAFKAPFELMLDSVYSDFCHGEQEVGINGTSLISEEDLLYYCCQQISINMFPCSCFVSVFSTWELSFRYFVCSDVICV